MVHARKEEWGWRSERCGRRDLCDGQEFFVVSQWSSCFVCVSVFFLNSVSWGAIPSICFVCRMCALKYIIIITIMYHAEHPINLGGMYC